MARDVSFPHGRRGAHACVAVAGPAVAFRARAAVGKGAGAEVLGLFLHALCRVAGFDAGLDAALADLRAVADDHDLAGRRVEVPLLDLGRACRVFFQVTRGVVLHHGLRDLHDQHLVAWLVGRGVVLFQLLGEDGYFPADHAEWAGHVLARAWEHQ